jgi:hypothetical protein
MGAIGGSEPQGLTNNPLPSKSSHKTRQANKNEANLSTTEALSH